MKTEESEIYIDTPISFTNYEIPSFKTEEVFMNLYDAEIQKEDYDSYNEINDTDHDEIKSISKKEINKPKPKYSIKNKPKKVSKVTKKNIYQENLPISSTFYCGKYIYMYLFAT